MEDLPHNFEFEDVSHFLIWDHMPSAKEKYRFRRELALASQNIPESVEAVVKSLPWVMQKVHTAYANLP